MSIELTKRFAPGLLHLAEQLVPHDSVICSFSAGPQNGYTSAWGDVPFIVIQPETLYGYDPDFVVIRGEHDCTCLLYTSPSPRDATLSRMPSSA